MHEIRRPIEVLAIEGWASYWWQQDDARLRAEGLLRVLAAASDGAIIDLGRRTREVDPVAQIAVRQRAHQTFYRMDYLPIVGEELATCEIDDQIRAVAAHHGVVREHGHGGVAEDGSRDIFDWALMGAHDALSALIVSDELSGKDFKSLTRPWRKAIGSLAPPD